MKLAYKIVLINLAIAVVITCFFLVTEGSGNSGSDVALAFGLVCLVMSFINLFVGLVLWLTDRKIWGKGMMLSFAFLLLLSGISCGSGFSGMKF